MDYEYSSREYQVVLRSDLLVNSFEAGVTWILEELTKIEDSKTINFKVSRSSLKFKNVSVVRYVSDNNRDSKDFYIPVKFKSRKNKVDEPADIVMKFEMPIQH